MPQLFRPIVMTPTSVLIDRNGKIRGIFLGILYGEQKEAAERLLRKLVEEKPNTTNQKRAPRQKEPPSKESKGTAKR